MLALLLSCARPTLPETEAPASPSSVTATPQPAGSLVVALTVTNPWLMVIGSDSPRVAVYSDGSVIYTANSGSDLTPYVIGRLDAQAQARLVEHVDGALTGLQETYEASDWTDQPTNVLSLRRGSERKAVAVYGNLTDPAVRDATPKAFVSAWDELTALSVPSAVPWIPTRLEVMIWPFDYARTVGAKWPADWPQPGGPGSVAHGDMSSVFVDSAHLHEVIALLQATGQSGALGVGDRKMSMGLRFPFPE